MTSFRLRLSRSLGRVALMLADRPEWSRSTQAARARPLFAPGGVPQGLLERTLQVGLVNVAKPGIYVSRIPKSASTTMKETADDVALEAGATVLHATVPAAAQPVPLKSFLSCDVLVGHLANTPRATLGFRDWRTVTVLRDPLERLVSQWQQLRREGQSGRFRGAIRDEAVRLDLVEWLQLQCSRNVTLNEQAAWLVYSADLAIGGEPLPGRLTTDGHARLLMPAGLDERVLAAEAADAFDDLFMVGPVERAHDVVAEALALHLGGAPHPRIRRAHNPSNRPSADLIDGLPSDLQASLRLRTTTDAELYQRACEQWER